MCGCVWVCGWVRGGICACYPKANIYFWTQINEKVRRFSRHTSRTFKHDSLHSKLFLRTPGGRFLNRASTLQWVKREIICLFLVWYSRVDASLEPSSTGERVHVCTWMWESSAKTTHSFFTSPFLLTLIRSCCVSLRSILSGVKSSVEEGLFVFPVHAISNSTAPKVRRLTLEFERCTFISLGTVWYRTSKA